MNQWTVHRLVEVLPLCLLRHRLEQKRLQQPGRKGGGCFPPRRFPGPVLLSTPVRPIQCIVIVYVSRDKSSHDPSSGGLDGWEGWGQEDFPRSRHVLLSPRTSGVRQVPKIPILRVDDEHNSSTKTSSVAHLVLPRLGANNLPWPRECPNKRERWRPTVIFRVVGKGAVTLLQTIDDE